uniref:Guanylate kinase-associated protein mars n=1 Tax=Diabrotica virgifera virgifera TaxID=50390 RepID=A0A6P7FD58_DIAVI
MDLSDIFRKGLQNLHKDIFDKNYKRKSLLSRKESLMNARRQTRDTLMFNKRNIDINMSPYITPEPEKKRNVDPPKPKVEQPQPSKRYEMLKQWKEKRNKQKEEEKKRAKPLFKVCHVNQDIGLPNLDKVNKEIKGKPIKTFSTPTVLSFAPANHAFKPPNNMHSVQFAKPVERNRKPNNSLLSSQKPANATKSLIKSESRINVAKNHPRTETRANGNVSKDKSIEPRITQKKPVTQQREIIKKPTNHTKSYTAKTNLFSPQMTANNGQLAKPSQASKNVGWNLHDTFDMSDDICDQKERSGKKYKKTPIKPRNQINKSIEQPTPDEISPIEKKGSGLKKSVGKHVTPNKNISTYNKLTNKTPTNTTKMEVFKTPVGKAKTPKVNRSVKGTPSSIVKSKISASRESSKSKKDSSVIVIDDSVEDDDLEDELEKVVIYDDEEITLKTPIKKSRMSRVSSVRKSSVTKSKKLTSNTDSMLFNDIDNTFDAELQTINMMDGILKSEKKSTINNNTDINSEKRTPENKSLRNNNKSNIQEEIGSNEKTPNNKKRESTYISPFVTISRGKEAARKEFEIRKSTGGTFISPEGKDFSNTTSPQAGADYFEKLLNSQITRITAKCAAWEIYQESNNLSEETNDMINVVVGQSNLLITKKFEQFRGLISECKSFEYKEKPITCEDLHGFWDMMYNQVINLDNRFENLEKLRNNNWEEILPEKKVVPKRGRGRPKKPTTSSSSSIREMIKAARNKRKQDEGATLVLKTPEPVKKLTHVNNGTKDSLRVSLLKGSAVKRLSSPGLTMMKVTQAIKAGDGITPSKSILKTSMSNSIKRRHTKSVLFADDPKVEKVSRNLSFNLEDKENNPAEDIHVNNDDGKNNDNTTPVRRSSRRLSKTKCKSSLCS